MNTQNNPDSKALLKELKTEMDTGNLTRALEIEHILIDDRCESILRHAGLYEPEKHASTEAKLQRLNTLVSGRDPLLSLHFGVKLLQEIIAWEHSRNALADTDGAAAAAAARTGHVLVQELCIRVKRYKRAL